MKTELSSFVWFVLFFVSCAPSPMRSEKALVEGRMEQPFQAVGDRHASNVLTHIVVPRLS